MVATAEVKGQINLTAVFDGIQIAVSVEMQSPMSITINFGGGNGVTAHEDLTGRSLPDAHPISSITGLSAEILEAKSSASTALSVAEGKEDKGVAATQVAAIVDGVASGGDTLKKLYNLILSSFTEVTVADVAARNAYNAPLGCHVFVADDGDGKWSLYKAITEGVNASYVKLSDPDLLNAAMTGSAIKIAYESNPDTNAFTNALLARLNGLSATSSPEFAALLITTLDSVANGGIIPNTEATWLGAQAKNVLSVLQKLVSKAFALDGRVAVLEDRVIADITTTSIQTSVDITGLNFNDGDVFTVESYGTSSVESGVQYLVLNNKSVNEYWYSATTAYTGFLGLTGGYYRNHWTVRVRGFNCFCTIDHHRSVAAGNSFTIVRTTQQTKPTTIGGVIATPITRITLTGNANAIAVGTRIIIKKALV